MLVATLLAGALSGCDGIFGSKSDDTTEEIFQQGQIDPTLVSDVGYVPLSPAFTQGASGAFDAPTDVFVGYDELVYVGDRNGLNVLDRAGRPQLLLSEIGYDTNGDGTADAQVQPLRDITAIVQDRHLDVYVAARRDTTVTGANCPSAGGPEACDLAVVYRIRGLTTGQPVLVDVLWHPFDDGSRRFTRFNLPNTYGPYSDEDASFSGVAVLADNTLYVTRRGPVNTTASGRPNEAFSPFNAFLIYTSAGAYVQYVRALTPDRPSLLSAYWPSDVITFVGPPQRAQASQSPDFLIAQDAPDGATTAPYGVVSVQIVQTSDGIDYRVDSGRLAAASTIPRNGDGALFELNQFRHPTSLAYAPDQSGYLFVLDAGKDSLFVFNPAGIEGVTPPPGAGTTRPIRASFGGTGSGPLQFSSPQGVAYFEQVVYVADTGNNRISRFRLNTDFE